MKKFDQSKKKYNEVNGFIPWQGKKLSSATDYLRNFIIIKGWSFKRSLWGLEILTTRIIIFDSIQVLNQTVQSNDNK